MTPPTHRPPRVGDLVRFSFVYRKVIGVVLEVTPPREGSRWGSPAMAPSSTVRILNLDGSIDVYDAWDDMGFEVLNEGW